METSSNVERSSEAPSAATSDGDWRTEDLWSTIRRYDHYYGTTNFKSSVLSSINVFVVSVGLGATSLVFSSWSGGWAEIGALITILLVVCVSLVSLVFSLLSIYPYLGAGRKPKSVLFFEDVSRLGSPQQLEARVLSLTPDDRRHDLNEQVYYLAVGLSEKFRKQRFAIVSLLLTVPGFVFLAFFLTAMSLGDS